MAACGRTIKRAILHVKHKHYAHYDDDDECPAVYLPNLQSSYVGQYRYVCTVRYRQRKVEIRNTTTNVNVSDINRYISNFDILLTVHLNTFIS